VSAFNVKVTNVVHSGGSKFYQIIAIQGKTASVCLTHWGKFSGSRILQPRQTGETKLETHSTASGGAMELRKKVHEKSKRGYKDWEEKDTPMTAKQLEHFIADTIPDDKQKVMLAHLMDDASVEDIDGPPETMKPEPKREPSAPTTKTSSKEWGTW
jgi:predicted DNA-binding WGR domain protein